MKLDSSVQRLGHIMLSFLFSVGLSFGSIDLAQLPAQEVEIIAKKVIAEMQRDLPATPSLIVTERPEPTPLGALSYANGKCVLIVNTNVSAWSQWGRFLNESNRQEWPQIIAASVAHEVGHCTRESLKFAASYQIDSNQLRGLQNTGQSGTSSEMSYKQELFADTVAVLYAREYAGENADKVINTIIKAREYFGSKEPTHNTAVVLNRLVEKDLQRLEQESIGAAATRLLSSL